MSQDCLNLAIDGEEITVPTGTTIWDAARSIGKSIPTLCHDPRLSPIGVCRLCVVDTGARTMPASCVRQCEEGMQVKTDTAELETHRRALIELLLSEQPDVSAREEVTADDELYALARRYGVETVPYPDASGNGHRGTDYSSPVIAVDHQACILCDRCIRGCNELQSNNVITRSGKGYESRIAFDLDVPMGLSTCVSCGECAAVCPTGALTHKPVDAVALEEEG